MNIALLLGSGRLRPPQPITALERHPDHENELDALNRRLDTKQIDFIEYLEGITQFIQKENQQ